MLDHLLRLYHRAPEHPAKLRVVRWLGRHAFPAEGIISSVWPDVRLHLHPRDWMEYLLLRGERYEPKTLELMQRALRPGDTAVLAGVNFGLHLIVAARAVGAGGRAVGVEPQPASLRRAAANLALSDSAVSAELVAAALGERSQLALMSWAPEDNHGSVSFFDERTGGFHVPMLTWGELASSLAIERVRLLLLDVQGYETRILRTLHEGPLPEVAIVEAHAEFLARAGSSIEEMTELLRSLGYVLYDLSGRELARDQLEMEEGNVVALGAGAPSPFVAPRVALS